MFIKTKILQVRHLSLSIIILLASLFISSCATNKSVLFKSKHDDILDTLKTVYVVNDKGVSDTYYRIKAQDIIAISNLQNLEFGVVGEVSSASSFTVDNDGTVNFPVLGKVTLAGLTKLEARAKLQDLYSNSLLKNPIIDLKIVNLKVTLLGDFGQRGKFLLEKEQTTLIDLLGDVGGLSPQADPRKIKIIRGDRNNPEIIYVNLQNINSLGSKRLILQNNDIIYAYRRKTHERAESFQNFNLFVQPALILFNTALIIYNLTK